MFENWKRICPDSNMTEKQLAVQGRFIARNELFREDELKEIQKNCEAKRPKAILEETQITTE